MVISSLMDGQVSNGQTRPSRARTRKRLLFRSSMCEARRRSGGGRKLVTGQYSVGLSPTLGTVDFSPRLTMSSRSTTEGKTPYLSRRLVGFAKKPSTALIQENDLAYPIGRRSLVTQKSVDAFVQEPLLPAPDKGLGLGGLGHDRPICNGRRVSTGQSAPARHAFGGHGGGDDGSQSLAITAG